MRQHLFVLLFGLAACKTQHVVPTATATPKTYFTAKLTDTTFKTTEHMLTSMEMQLSGEPFAQLLGRNLQGYDRFSRIPDLYLDHVTGQTLLDPLSYSMAIESYEYSKQPMNQLAFESGAGLSLMYGKALNPMAVTGDAAFNLLRTRLAYLALASGSGGPPGTAFVTSPPPPNNPLNYYGWAGYWPSFAEFRSFKPDIAPLGGAALGCTLSGGYAAASLGKQFVGTYECGYVSLNLINREAQVEKVIEPAALGYTMWKEGLWVINYWQSAHDSFNNAIISVAPADMPQVGVPGNQVIGQYIDPNDPLGDRVLPGQPGVYLGDVPLEGWQGLTMLEEAQNKAVLLLQTLPTTDGAKLAGFASTKAAIDYDYQSQLMWWPAAVAVTESGGTVPPAGEAWRDFPQPTTFAVQTGTSRLWDLEGIAGGFAEYFALTDANNANVGGSVGPLATFDGDPFLADNGKPDGEDSPHDRALAVLKVAAINIDRIHFDASHNVLVDEATMVGGTMQKGTTVTTLYAAYAIVGLRTLLRSITSNLALYSNDTPDTHAATTALDGSQLRGLTGDLQTRIVALITAEADFIVAKLMSPTGRIANSYDLAKGAADTSAPTLQSESAAIRGLLDAYLATSQEKYRTAATLIYNDLDKNFWMKDVRAFQTTQGERNTLTWTPVAFGTVQGAMRQFWKLVAARPGNELMAAELLERVKRINKLVANGWDDANLDDKVQAPDECTGAGLQLGERALTGEKGIVEDDDADCVKEISFAKLPAALGAQLVLQRRAAQ